MGFSTELLNPCGGVQLQYARSPLFEAPQPVQEPLHVVALPTPQWKHTAFGIVGLPGRACKMEEDDGRGINCLLLGNNWTVARKNAGYDVVYSFDKLFLDRNESSRKSWFAHHPLTPHPTPPFGSFCMGDDVRPCSL
jgi:hypothetical protein